MPAACLRVYLAVLSFAVSAGATGAHRLGHLAQRYFDAWNAKDTTRLEDLFSDDVTLRDWEVDKSGSIEVVQANADIWKRIPGISIEVISLHVSNETQTVCAEILVHTPTQTLKVVDVITYNARGLVLSVHAYKG